LQKRAPLDLCRRSRLEAAKTANRLQFAEI
jgi:hypothetical protein